MSMLLHYEEEVSRYPRRSRTRTTEEPDCCGHRPWHTPQQRVVFLPDGARLDRFVEVSIGASELLFEPADVSVGMRLATFSGAI